MPDYVQIASVTWDLPAFDLQRLRWKANGTGTLVVTPVATAGAGSSCDKTKPQGGDLDIFALRVDPRTNQGYEDPIAGTTCVPATGGLGFKLGGVGGAANIWAIAYDVVFGAGLASTATVDPCGALYTSGLATAGNPLTDKCPGGGLNPQETFAILSPVSRDIVARTRHKEANPDNATFDVLGVPHVDGNGQYTRPLGIGLGCLLPPTPIDFNLANSAEPIAFEGLPWALDRRGGPNGCINGACENVFEPRSPFPFSGINPGGAVNGVPSGRPEPADRVLSLFAKVGYMAPGNFLLAETPIPVDDQCALGSPRSDIVSQSSLAATAPTSPAASGCAQAPSGRAPASLFALSLLGVALAAARRRR